MLIIRRKRNAICLRSNHLLQHASDVVCSDKPHTDLFVDDLGVIGHYTTSGATVNGFLISTDDFFGSVIDLEASGSSLFLGHNYGDDGKTAKYDVDGGIAVDGPTTVPETLSTL